MRFPVIVFDFDGTLVASNEVKRRGFDHVFADRPECLAALPATLERLNAQSRFEIIQSVVSVIPDLGAAEREAEAARKTTAYSAWVEERVVECAQQSPAGLLLPRWSRHAALYVCSLTPTEPLERILRQLAWLSYFSGVEGHPVNKPDMLRRTGRRHGVRTDEVLMVGDSHGDAAAASEAGAAFFQIEHVRDLLRLDEYLSA
jgi:phosphoglycolate phosphatase